MMVEVNYSATISPGDDFADFDLETYEPVTNSYFIKLM